MSTQKVHLLRTKSVNRPHFLNRPKSVKRSKSANRPKSEPTHFKPSNFKIPEPTDAPKNLEPVIDHIQDTLDKLSKVGKEKGAVHYRGNVYLAEIAYIAIINKFEGICIPSYHTDRLHINLMINSNQANTPIFNDYYTLFNFGQSLKDCIDRNVPIICIFLSLNFEDKPKGHANLLIYRPFKRTIERFEPHGKRYSNDRTADLSINKQLKELFEETLNSFTNGKVRFFPPNQICPYMKGFQSLEGRIERLHIEGGGFCIMWSLFFMEMILNNPTKTTKDILQTVMDITKQDPQFLKDTIRGYVVSIEQLLDTTYKYVDNQGFSFENARQSHLNSDNIHSFIIDSIMKSKETIREKTSYNSLPNSLDLTLYDRLIQLSIEQFKQLAIKLYKRVPIFMRRDIHSIKYMVDIIMEHYDEDTIEHYLHEILSNKNV